MINNDSILNFVTDNVKLDDDFFCKYDNLIKQKEEDIESGLYSSYTGWRNHLSISKKQEVMEIIGLSQKCSKMGIDTLLVVGVGGSFLGTQAIYNALTTYFKKELQVEIIFLGNNLSGEYLQEVLTYIKDKNICVNVISKSGDTMETSIAFNLIKAYLIENYPDTYKDKIIITTDKSDGILREIVMKEGYQSLSIPKDIGGRFSVFTPVSLFPLSIVGIDIVSLLKGAEQGFIDFSNNYSLDNPAYLYASIRHYLHNKGYKIEILASFEPKLKSIHEWWKQLFGESEGKEKKGLFPSSVSYSTDLHSLGQYVQEGNDIIFETILNIKNIENDVDLPSEILGEFTLNTINKLALQGTVIAHSKDNIPVINIELEKLDAYNIGYLMYFFMEACTMSALLLEVNPFNQPGVEKYKKSIKELLNNQKGLEKI